MVVGTNWSSIRSLEVLLSVKIAITVAHVPRHLFDGFWSSEGFSALPSLM